MKRSSDRKLQRKKNVFTPDEDEKLRKLVQKFGDKSWHRIADKMPKRSTRQCHDRWVYYLSPSVINGTWAQEEDDLLKSKVAAFGHKWKFFTQFFVGRTDINIKNRYNFLKKKEMKMLKNKINKATEVSFEEEKMGEKEKETNKESMMDFLPDSIFGCIDNDSPCSLFDVQCDELPGSFF